MERVDLAECIGTWDWRNLQADLDRDGFALTPRLLDDNDCAKLKEQFDQDTLFRKSVVMEKHAYGRGQYRYWAYPLPGVVNQLRQCFYPYLAGIANHWQTLLQLDASYPGDLEAYLAECHRAGQTQPTPLLLRYREGDYNRLHRDLYGEWCFPLQVVVLLAASSSALNFAISRRCFFSSAKKLEPPLRPAKKASSSAINPSRPSAQMARRRAIALRPVCKVKDVSTNSSWGHSFR